MMCVFRGFTSCGTAAWGTPTDSVHLSNQTQRNSRHADISWTLSLRQRGNNHAGTNSSHALHGPPQGPASCREVLAHTDCGAAPQQTEPSRDTCTEPSVNRRAGQLYTADGQRDRPQMRGMRPPLQPARRCARQRGGGTAPRRISASSDNSVPPIDNRVS